MLRQCLASMLQLSQRRIYCLKIKQAKLCSPVSFDGASPVRVCSLRARRGSRPPYFPGSAE